MTLIYKDPEDGEWKPAIRKLSTKERDIFAGAVVQAASLLPAWRDGIALMRPFFDATADTAYIDKYSRVGLGQWFFKDLDVFQRASVILHETSHVLYNCFTRGEVLGAEPQLNNIASDFEINTGLDSLPRVDLSFAIFPDRGQFSYPANLSQEQYYHLLKADNFQPPKQDGSGQPDPDCPQHGDKSKGDKSNDSNADADKDEKGDDAGNQPGDSDEQGEGNDGNQPGDKGSGDQGDEAGDGGSGDEAGEQGDGDSPGDGKGGGSGDGEGQPQAGHGHGNSGPPCTCPPESSGDGDGGGEGESDGSGKPGKGSGKGKSAGDSNTKGCDEATEKRVEAADDAGVERASDAEQSIAKKNTAARVAEEAKKARAAGNGHMADFLDLSLSKMTPPKVNWRSIFRRIISKMDEAVVRGRSDYSYRRTSRRLSNSPFIFPGMVQYQPKAMIGVDTSGSMSHEDHLASAVEIEGILKTVSRARNQIKVFSVDTQVTNIKPVSSVSKLDLRGGGGTAMEVAWMYVNSLTNREKPDIFILATDGYTAWAPVEEQVIIGNKHYKSVILVTTEGGYASVPDSLKAKAHVVDISEGQK